MLPLQFRFAATLPLSKEVAASAVPVAPTGAEVLDRLRSHRGLVDRLSPESLARLRDGAVDHEPEADGVPLHSTLMAEK